MQDWTCLFSDEFSTDGMELQFSQYLHQSTSVPSTDMVCSAIRYRNIDPLGRRHEYTGGFPHEVSVTDTWCMLVGSCLQCRGASAIWFVKDWWHLTSSTLISVCPCKPGPWWWCSASEGVRLQRQKGQLEKTAESPSQRLAQQSLGGYQRSTVLLCTLWRSEIARGHGAELRSLGLLDDDNGDEGWLVSKMEGKT